MKDFDNIAEKGEKAGNLHSLLLPQCFTILSQPNLTISATFHCPTQMLSIWVSPLFCHLVN